MFGSMATLHTTDPIALRYLLSETLYAGTDQQDEMDIGPSVQATDMKGASVEYRFVHLGQNRERFLFITASTEHPYMSPPALEAFEKTVQALGLRLEDIALWNRLSGRDIGYDTIKGYFEPVKTVFLGKEAFPPDLVQMPMDTITDREGCKMLYSYSFEEMLASKEKKIAFWKLIKNL